MCDKMLSMLLLPSAMDHVQLTIKILEKQEAVKKKILSLLLNVEW